MSIICKGALALIVCLLGVADTAMASDCIWTGLSPTSALWSADNNENWKDCLPQTGDSVTFPDGAARPVNTPGRAFDLDSITIVGRGAGGVAWTIGATGELDIKSLTVTSPPDTLGNGPSVLADIDLDGVATITTHRHAAGASTLTLGDIHLSADTTTFNLESPATVPGRIRGNCVLNPIGLIKDGPSVLTLNDNGYCGATVINAGTVAQTILTPWALRTTTRAWSQRSRGAA